MMWNPRHPKRPRRDAVELPLDELASGIKAPDVTRAVMGRLGYMRVSAKVARRQRLHRWASRCGLTLAVLMALGLGVRMHNESARARRPLERNVPAALGSDLNTQRQRFNDMIQSIRRSAPLQAIPVQQPSPVVDDEGTAVDDDILRADSLPMRWV